MAKFLKINLFIIAFTIFSMDVSAHICHPEVVQCPIDGHEVEFCVTSSMTTYGSYADFQQKGAVGNHYEELINHCENCKFSGFKNDFKKSYSDSEIKKIKECLTPYKSQSLTEYQQCKVAAEIKIALDEKNDAISYCYLVGSYLLKSNDSLKSWRIDFQLKAIEFYLKTIENNEYENAKHLNATVYYLIGELYRRTDNFQQSIYFFDLSEKQSEKEGWLDELIHNQRKMAIEKDSNNEI